MAAVVQDEQLARQFTNEDSALGCQWVTPGHHSVKRFRLERLRAEERCVGRLHGARERDIEGASFQGAMLHGRRHLHQRELHLSKAMAEFFDQAGEKGSRSADKEADGKRPDLTACRLLHICNGSIGGSKHFSGVLQKLLTVICEPNASVLSIKERNA